MMSMKKILMPFYYFESYWGEYKPFSDCYPKTFKIFNKNKFKQGDYVYFLETNPFEIPTTEEVDFAKKSDRNEDKFDGRIWQEIETDFGKDVLFFTGRFMVMQIVGEHSDFLFLTGNAAIFQVEKLGAFDICKCSTLMDQMNYILTEIKKAEFIVDEVDIGKLLTPSKEEVNIEKISDEYNHSFSEWKRLFEKP